MNFIRNILNLKSNNKCIHCKIPIIRSSGMDFDNIMMGVAYTYIGSIGCVIMYDKYNYFGASYEKIRSKSLFK